MFDGDEDDLFGAFEGVPTAGTKRSAIEAVVEAEPAPKRPVTSDSSLGGLAASQTEEGSAPESTGKTCKHEVAMPEGVEATEDMLSLSYVYSGGKVRRTWSVRTCTCIPCSCQANTPLARVATRAADVCCYRPPQPAREYKFELDPFQKAAIAAIEVMFASFPAAQRACTPPD